MSRGTLKVGFWWATSNGAIATVLFVVWCAMPWLSTEVTAVTQVITTVSLGIVGALNTGLAIGLWCGVRLADDLQGHIDYLSDVRNHLYEELRKTHGHGTGEDEDSDSCEVDDQEGHA